MSRPIDPSAIQPFTLTVGTRVFTGVIISADEGQPPPITQVRQEDPSPSRKPRRSKIDKALPAWLRTQRAKYQITQERLAIEAGHSPSLISRVESGTSTHGPTERTKQDIVRAMRRLIRAAKTVPSKDDKANTPSPEETSP